jgi:hypothetical protein
MRPYLKKKTHHKEGWWSGSRCGLSVETTVLKKGGAKNFSELLRMENFILHTPHTSCTLLSHLSLTHHYLPFYMLI